MSLRAPVYSTEALAAVSYTHLDVYKRQVQAGAEWKAFKHLNVYADLVWGLNDIFKKEFKTITFNMYPIYLNVGFGYAF